MKKTKDFMLGFAVATFLLLAVLVAAEVINTKLTVTSQTSDRIISQTVQSRTTTDEYLSSIVEEKVVADEKLNVSKEFTTNFITCRQNLTSIKKCNEALKTALR